MHPDLRPKRVPGTAFRVIDGEAVIVLPKAMELRILSTTGTRVWELIDGERTVGQIGEVLAAEFEVGQDQVRRDVDEFLAELRRAGLVVLDGE